MNTKLLKSGHIKLYKRENSKFWQMKIKLPKVRAIRSSTGSKILKEAESKDFQIIMTEKDYFKIDHFNLEKIKYLKILLKVDNQEIFIDEVRKLIQ